MFKIIPNSAGRKASRTDLGRFISYDDIRLFSQGGARIKYTIGDNHFVDKNKFIYEFGLFTDEYYSGGNYYTYPYSYYKRINGHTGDVTHFVSVGEGNYNANPITVIQNGFYDRPANKIYVVGRKYVYQDSKQQVGFLMRIDCDTGDIEEVTSVGTTTNSGGYAAVPQNANVVLPWGKQHFIVFGQGDQPNSNSTVDGALGVVFRKDTLQPESFSSSTVYYNNFETFGAGTAASGSPSNIADITPLSAAGNYDNKLIAVGSTVISGFNANVASSALITLWKQASNNTWSKITYEFNDDSSKLNSQYYRPGPYHMYWNADCTKLYVNFKETDAIAAPFGYNRYFETMARFSYTSGSPGTLSLDWVKSFDEGNEEYHTYSGTPMIKVTPIAFDRDNNKHHMIHQPYWRDGSSTFLSNQWNYVIWDEDFSTREDNLGFQNGARYQNVRNRIYEADGSVSVVNRVIPNTWDTLGGNNLETLTRYYDSDDNTNGIPDYFLLGGRKSQTGTAGTEEYNSTYVLADFRIGKESPTQINKPSGIISYGAQATPNISGSNGYDQDTMWYWTDKFVTPADSNFSVTDPDSVNSAYRHSTIYVTACRTPVTLTSQFDFATTSYYNGSETGTPYSGGTWSAKRVPNFSNKLLVDARYNSNKSSQGGNTIYGYSNYPTPNEFYSDLTNTYLEGSNWTDDNGTNRLKDYPGYFLSFENQNMADSNATADEILPFDNTLTISQNTTNYDVESELLAEGWNGTDDVTLTINSGVYVYSNNTSTAAITISSALNNKLTINNNGNIYGRGGGASQDGGDAISNSASGVTIINASGAFIAGGGGGGGGTGGGGGAGQAAPGVAGAAARSISQTYTSSGSYQFGCSEGGVVIARCSGPSYATITFAAGGDQGAQAGPGGQTTGSGGTCYASGTGGGPPPCTVSNVAIGYGGIIVNTGYGGEGGSILSASTNVTQSGGGWGASGTGSGAGTGGAAISGTAATITNNGTIYGST